LYFSIPKEILSIRLHKLITATTELVIVLQVKASDFFPLHKVARPPCCYSFDKAQKIKILRKGDWLFGDK
jgi:hypothetical protein